MVKVIRPILNQKGQALFEMILFLPFLMFLYTIYYTIGNSISASINQQKAVRGYFYNQVKGNSYIISMSELQKFRENYNITKVGFNSVGWGSHMSGDSLPFAPCFKFSSLLKNNSTEKCEDSARDEEGSSRFVRVFTYYGVCGPAYVYTPSPGPFPDYYDIDPRNQGSAQSCTLGN